MGTDDLKIILVIAGLGCLFRTALKCYDGADSEIDEIVDIIIACSMIIGGLII